MTKQDDQNIISGANRVEEREHLASGLSEPTDISAVELAPENRKHGEPDLKTALADLTLSMFPQGSSVRVRVGNAHNASELYEQVYASAEEANAAMLDGGILTAKQVPDPSQVAGTGLQLEGITVEQLESSGLKRHGASTI